MEDENLYDEFGNYIGPEILDNVISSFLPCLYNNFLRMRKRTSTSLSQTIPKVPMMMKKSSKNQKK